MMAAAQQPAPQLESGGGPSTEAPMIMHRVSTMEMIAAEEGEQSPKYTSNRNPSGLRTGPPEGWSHQPGWAVPTADTIADMVKSFVKDEATHLRSDYMSRVAAVARGSLERVDNLVEKFVDSERSNTLLPTAAPAGGPPPRDLKNGLIDAQI